MIKFNLDSIIFSMLIIAQSSVCYLRRKLPKAVMDMRGITESYKG